MCGAQTSSRSDAVRGVDQRRRLLERGRHRLLDEHVLAVLEPGQRQVAVLVHAGQHQHGVDVVAVEHLLGSAEVGVDAEPRGRRLPLVGVDVVPRHQLGLAVQGELLDERGVRAPEDTAESEDSQAHGHAVFLSVAADQAYHSGRCHGMWRGSGSGMARRGEPHDQRAPGLGAGVGAGVVQGPAEVDRRAAGGQRAGHGLLDQLQRLELEPVRVGVDQLVRLDAEVVAAGHELHAAVLQRGRLQRDPDAQAAVLVRRVPVGLVLVPRRRGAVLGGLADRVHASRADLVAQQLRGDPSGRWRRRRSRAARARSGRGSRSGAARAVRPRRRPARAGPSRRPVRRARTAGRRRPGAGSPPPRW